MTTQIRKSVFETNSSSTHSIHIDDGKYVSDLIFVDNDEVLRIYPGEFGWEVEDYYDAASKASYCMTYLYQCAQRYSKDYKESWYDFSGHLQKWLNMLTEVLKEETGASKVEYRQNDDKYYPYGYIDHQSAQGDRDTCGPVFESKETLRNFIFNPNSYLHTDNDNY
jgi:hypothetical protein